MAQDIFRREPSVVRLQLCEPRFGSHRDHRGSLPGIADGRWSMMAREGVTHAGLSTVPEWAEPWLGFVHTFLVVLGNDIRAEARCARPSSLWFFSASSWRPYLLSVSPVSPRSIGILFPGFYGDASSSHLFLALGGPFFEKLRMALSMRWCFLLQTEEAS